MRSHFKRWIYLTHRWLGVGLSLLLLMWFISGLVMMYVGYPKLTEQERLQHLPRLVQADAERALLSPAQVLQAAGIEDVQPVRSLRLNRARAGEPIYWLVHQGQGLLVLDAYTGARLHNADEPLAQISAQVYAGANRQVLAKGALTEDANTHSRGLDAHRPLWRFDIVDGPLARLYVSSTTGEVVRDVSRTESYWNWFGAWAHWLYIFRGNVFDAYQGDIINWLSLISMGLVVSGVVVGIWRWRFRAPYKSGSRSPYVSQWMRWHHILGLLFAAICLTWLFSGLMSMRPWGLLRTVPPALNITAMHGSFAWAPLHSRPWSAAQASEDLRELRWLPLLGESVAVMVDGQGRSQAFNLRTNDRHAPSQESVIDAAAVLLSANIAAEHTLLEYDLYYYDRSPHTMNGGRDKPLPIYRVEFDDAQKTWVHLDASTGQVLGSLTSTARTSRWLFAMLHSWDWLPLLNRRPLWDGLLIVLCLGGVGISASGLVIGWRRLRKKIS